jgi:hypothetical protein
VSAARLWPIATIVFGLAGLGVLLSFSQLPEVVSVYPSGAFGPALSAFQRAASMADLAAIFGSPPDPAKIAAMTAGNQLDLFAFIPAYTLFLIAAGIMLAGDPKQPLAWLAIMTALIAAVGDVMETAGQLGITTDWTHAETYLRFVAPAAWIKFFALAAHALVCAAICYRSEPKRRIVGALGCIPVLGVLAAALDLAPIPSLMTSVFGAFWIALIVVATLKVVRPPSAAPAKDATP